jgi:hypothetical protein
MRQQRHLSEDEARRLCREWQEALRLQDWDIVVKVVRGRGLGTDGLENNAEGRGHWTLPLRAATIRLATLVHEMLHLHFAGFDDFTVGDAQDVAAEQAIHALSCALVALKRGGGANCSSGV